MALTLEQMKANRKLWVEALRSGKYEQTTGVLRNAGEGRCCLGVACEVLSTQWEKNGADYWTPLGFKMDGYLPEPIGQRFGLDSQAMAKFVRWNDNVRKSFEEIADIIEREPPGLFVESEQP
jgi:hypothetical protein